MRRPRTTVLVFGGLLGFGLLPVASSPAGGQVDFPDAAFSGYATGSAVHAGALPGPSGVLDAMVGFSAASVNSGGLGAGQRDELGAVVSPGGQPTKRSAARGRGIDVSVLASTLNGVIGHPLVLAGAAESAAPPTPSRVDDVAGPLAAAPVVAASLAGAEATPAWSDHTCVAGRPLSSASGRAAHVRLAERLLPGAAGPLVATSGEGDGDIARSTSQAYLVPNDDGSFGLVTETRQRLAPLTVLAGTPAETTVEVLGELVLRAIATGKPGGAKVEYAPAGQAGPKAPFLRITRGTGSVEVATEDVFGARGLRLPAGPALDVAVGEAPHRAASAGAAPEQASDGSRAAAAVDVVRLTVLPGALPGGTGTGAVEVHLGHLEAAAEVPAGGIGCRLPVRKAVDHERVEPGHEFTFTISIPASAGALEGLACDLSRVRAVDVISAPPDVQFTLLSASGGGTIEGETVVWKDLGRYHPGDPPAIVTVTGRVNGDSAPGVVEDTVVAGADLAGCEAAPGGGTGRSPVRLAGRATLAGPRIVR